MLKQKRTKFSRMRGSMTHGGGHKKKRRGAGHRGGVGNAGSGARGDSKKPSFLVKYGNTYFGKSGFHSVGRSENKIISLRDIEENFDLMVEAGLIVKEGKEFVFDATLNGIDKVLGKTEFTKKVKVIVEQISANAKQRIIDAGGSVESEDEFESDESESKE